jgi:hypothetical protein
MTSAGTGTPAGATTTVRPRMTATLYTLDPSKLSIARSRSPRNVETSVVTNSGAVVPIATMVRPMTVSLTPSAWAISAPPTRSWAPMRMAATLDHELNDESNEGGPAFGRPSHVARADGVRVSSARVEDAARVDDAPQQQEDAVRRAEDAVARQRVEDQRGDHHRRQVEPQRPPLEATGTSRAARPR